MARTAKILLGFLENIAGCHYNPLNSTDMKTCPQCQHLYAESMSLCPSDGSALVTTTVPHPTSSRRLSRIAVLAAVLTGVITVVIVGYLVWKPLPKAPAITSPTLKLESYPNPRAAAISVIGATSDLYWIYDASG